MGFADDFPTCSLCDTPSEQTHFMPAFSQKNPIKCICEKCKPKITSRSGSEDTDTEMPPCKLSTTVNQKNLDFVSLCSAKPCTLSKNTGMGVSSKMQKISHDKKVRFLSADDVAVAHHQMGSPRSTQILGKAAALKSFTSTENRTTLGRNSLQKYTNLQHQDVLLDKSKNDEDAPPSFPTRTSKYGRKSLTETTEDGPDKRVSPAFLYSMEESSNSQHQVVLMHKSNNYNDFPPGFYTKPSSFGRKCISEMVEDGPGGRVSPASCAGSLPLVSCKEAGLAVTHRPPRENVNGKKDPVHRKVRFYDAEPGTMTIPSEKVHVSGCRTAKTTSNATLSSSAVLKPPSNSDAGKQNWPLRNNSCCNGDPWTTLTASKKVHASSSWRKNMDADATCPSSPWPASNSGKKDSFHRKETSGPGTTLTTSKKVHGSSSKRENIGSNATRPSPLTISSGKKDLQPRKVSFCSNGPVTSRGPSENLNYPSSRTENIAFDVTCSSSAPPIRNSDRKASHPVKESCFSGDPVTSEIPSGNAHASTSGEEIAASDAKCSPSSAVNSPPITCPGISLSHPDSSQIEIQDRYEGRIFPNKPKYCQNGPALKVIWRGCFEVLNVESDIRLCAEFLAHPSAKLSRKAYIFATQIAGVMQFRMHPRADIWPAIFEEDCPDRNDIALYFYPGITDKSIKQYSALLKLIEKQDLVLRSPMDHIELLVFPSKLLQVYAQKLDGSYFLWGVFRHLKGSPVRRGGGFP